MLKSVPLFAKVAAIAAVMVLVAADISQAQVGVYYGGRGGRVGVSVGQPYYGGYYGGGYWGSGYYGGGYYPYGYGSGYGYSAPYSYYSTGPTYSAGPYSYPSNMTFSTQNSANQSF